MACRNNRRPRRTRPFVSQRLDKLAFLQNPILTPSEILSSAHVSDDIPPEMLATMPIEDARVLEEGRRAGCCLVHVYWPTGQSALMFCPPGRDIPEPNMVVQAYERHVARSLGRSAGLKGGA